jgi:hypothetical protein
MILACFALIVIDRGQSIGTKPITSILSASGPAFVAGKARDTNPMNSSSAQLGRKKMNSRRYAIVVLRR